MKIIFYIISNHKIYGSDIYLNESNGSPFRSPSSHHLKTTKAIENAKWKGGDSSRAKTPEQKLETGWKKYVIYINFFF
jgi:UDP-N-acetylenolpyruvoylglucosamine reductase